MSILKKQMRLYKDLSWLWPIISPPETYVDEGEILIEKIKEYGGDSAKTVLNMGCGGGHLDWVLKKAFEVTSIDISRDMMALAKKLNPEVEYLYGDMRTVRMGRLFDAVVLHDAVIHMINMDELKSAFRTAYEHLKSGGFVVTYVEEWPEHFVQNRTAVSNHEKDGIEVTFIENNYDPDPSDSNYECTLVYLIRRQGRLEIETDRMTLGIFPVADWIEAMQVAGFEIFQTKYSLSKLPDAASAPTENIPDAYREKAVDYVGQKYSSFG